MLKYEKKYMKLNNKTTVQTNTNAQMKNLSTAPRLFPLPLWRFNYSNQTHKAWRHAYIF